MLNGVDDFYRTHRSYLINLRFIKQLVKKDGTYIIMDNGETVSLSKDKKEEFVSLVQGGLA